MMLIIINKNNCCYLISVTDDAIGRCQHIGCCVETKFPFDTLEFLRTFDCLRIRDIAVKSDVFSKARDLFNYPRATAGHSWYYRVGLHYFTRIIAVGSDTNTLCYRIVFCNIRIEMEKTVLRSMKDRNDYCNLLAKIVDNCSFDEDAFSDEIITGTANLRSISQ